MSIKRNGSQPSMKGPAETFTGNVRIDPLFQAPGTTPFGGASVTFEPGARSAWHTHPCGQVLIVTAGLGWTQCWGEPRGDPPLRCDYLSAQQEALAWRDLDHGHDSHRYPGVTQRQERRVAGEGH